MWRSLWRSIDRFSLQHFKYVINELRQIKVVDKHNRELVIDLLQSIVEIVTYGDRQDPMIFELFMEHQVLAEFVRVLKIGSNARVEAPLLQYLSIMIQNMDNEQAIYYCLSNDYVNNIIAHEYKFDMGDLAPYYVSFLRSVSSKLNRDTLCLLVRVEGDAVVSFPLYSEALKFSQHGEKMIQTAVRALTLNIYNVSDDLVYQYVTTPPASKYFSDLVHNLKKECFHLDGLVHSTKEVHVTRGKMDLLAETDKIVDDLYYFKDLLCVGKSRLSITVTQNLLNLLVFPLLLPLVKPAQDNGLNISAITSLYLVSRLLQILGGKDIVNSVAGFVLRPYMPSFLQDAVEGSAELAFPSGLDVLENLVPCHFESREHCNGNSFSGHFPELISSSFCAIGCLGDDDKSPERSRILGSIFLADDCLLLAFLFLLFTIANNRDLALTFQQNETKPEVNFDISASQAMNGSILMKFMPEILNALLNVLASNPPASGLTKWHTGWFLQKLLVSDSGRHGDHSFELFNTSYEQSLLCFENVLDGCWFDHVLDTLTTEWASCKKALEEPFDTKDPLFLLELVISHQCCSGEETSYVAWQRMVDVVKVFILHLNLRALIYKEELPERPFSEIMTSPSTSSGKTHTSDLSSASFGSEVYLGSGIPCRIAFSNAGIRDIYLIPVAVGTSGKLLLVEKHPFRNNRGVVIAIAPLAGLEPKIDEGHPTWLHLTIREFDPRLNASKTRCHNSKASSHVADGRWTLGFPNAKACEEAQLLIVEETSKQRSFVRRVLAPFLQNNDLRDQSKGQDE